MMSDPDVFSSHLGDPEGSSGLQGLQAPRRQTREAAKIGSAAAGKADPEAVIKVLRSGRKFDTTLGSIGFDGKGDVAAPGYVFYKWSQGSYDYVQCRPAKPSKT